MTTQSAEDARAINALIQRQFDSLSWSPETAGDWDGFAADFHLEARLYPSARPLAPLGVQDFVQRMQGLAGTSLQTFEEEVTGTNVILFGNVAVAAAGVAIAENGGPPGRSAEMMLLVKENDTWKIVAQAWDSDALTGQSLPDLLLNGNCTCN